MKQMASIRLNVLERTIQTYFFLRKKILTNDRLRTYTRIWYHSIDFMAAPSLRLKKMEKKVEPLRLKLNYKFISEITQKMQ